MCLRHIFTALHLRCIFYYLHCELSSWEEALIGKMFNDFIQARTGNRYWKIEFGY